MRNKNDRLTGVLQLGYALDTLRLEVCIAHGQHFVEEQNVGLEERCNCKAQSQIHAGGIPFHRHIDEWCDTSEINDARKLARDLSASHSKQRAVQINVLPPG